MTISLELVQNLIATQLPTWKHLPLTPVDKQGHDHVTFRLGDTMMVRIPTQACYAHQVVQEQAWLGNLAQQLTITIPQQLALGKPTKDFPWHWGIYGWIDGASLNHSSLSADMLMSLSDDLAVFLKELHGINAHKGPAPGAHNFYRGAHLSVYDHEVRAAVETLGHLVDIKKVLYLWQIACASSWQQKPVWVHGDMSAGNMLIKNNALTGIIDFGCMAVGDPACDLVVAWTLFDHASRTTFINHLNLDEATWTRARGWALWKALITLANTPDKVSNVALEQRKLIKTLTLS